eukprot:TCALIF_02355-PA protein Name:"Protein of unknown function" AED:0.27 eAED:0.27 QI:0/0.5/0.33/1/0/0/3/177/186
MKLVTAFLWNVIILYVLSQTNPNDDELLRARYLDIALGILGFSSALALTFGTVVENRLWLVGWFLGSCIVVITYWIKYVSLHFDMILSPESLDQFRLGLIILTALYGISTLIIVIYFKNLEPLSPRIHHVFIEWQSWPLIWPFISAHRSSSEKQTSTERQTKAKPAYSNMPHCQELGRREELYHPV